MNASSVTFPSVFETVFGNYESSAKDLLNGLKIKKNESWYFVGKLAQTAAVNPSRIVNASPTEEDFDILFKAAIANIIDKVQQPLAITLGFPFSTYNVYKTAAELYLSKRHFILEHDTRTFNINGAIKKNTFDVDVYDIIPEIVGGIIGIKKTIPQAANENFIALSFGFGTLEGTLATTEGIVHRTSFSSHGIRYVISNLARELSQKHNLEMKNEHQLDEAFVKGSLFTNRKRIDLTGLRKELLIQYYKEVVSPLLRKHFSDADLESCDKIYLMGGGAHYKELSNALAEEFGGFIPVEVVPNPETINSIGYLYNSYRISDSNIARSVGIDLGNASTVVSYFDSSNLPTK